MRFMLSTIAILILGCSSIDAWTGEHQHRQLDLPLPSTPGSVPEDGECVTQADCSRKPICDVWHLHCYKDYDGKRRCMRPVDACEHNWP